MDALEPLYHEEQDLKQDGRPRAQKGVVFSVTNALGFILLENFVCSI